MKRGKTHEKIRETTRAKRNQCRGREWRIIEDNRRKWGVIPIINILQKLKGKISEFEEEM